MTKIDCLRKEYISAVVSGETEEVGEAIVNLIQAYEMLDENGRKKAERILHKKDNHWDD
jgi:hypothetical protein